MARAPRAAAGAELTARLLAQSWGELGRSPGSREELCSWVSRASGGKRQRLHPTSASEAFNAQQSFAHPWELALQQQDFPRQKIEDSGIKQREHAVCAEHWYECRSAGAPGNLIKEIENTRWDQEAVVPGPV